MGPSTAKRYPGQVEAMASAPTDKRLGPREDVRRPPSKPPAATAPPALLAVVGERKAELIDIRLHSTLLN